MTGFQLVLGLALVVVAIGLGLLIWGKDRGTGTFKGLGIELNGSSSFLMLALGGGLIVYLVIFAPAKSRCLIFCGTPSLDIGQSGSQSHLVKAPVYGPKVRVASGGLSAANTGCMKRTAQSCVFPEHGGRLLPASGTIVDLVSDGPSGSNVVVDSPDQICIALWASTSTCETEVSISGRVMAVEEYSPAEKK